MSPLIVSIISFFMFLYLLTIITELIINRYIKNFILEILLLISIFIMLNLTTKFPVASSRQAFGGVSPIIAITIMFICTILGIIAHYFFYLKGKFSWKSFIKPLLISPIILLPLMGSVEGISHFESIQLVSFSILSFQNGFFWKVVFEHARK